MRMKLNSFLTLFFFTSLLWSHEIKTVQVKLIESNENGAWICKMKTPIVKGGKLASIRLFLNDSLVLNSVDDNSVISTNLKAIINTSKLSIKPSNKDVFRLEGLNTMGYNAIFEVNYIKENPIIKFISNSDEGFYFPRQNSLWENVKLYFKFGVEHILEGYDHLAFVFLITFLIVNLKSLFLAITSFSIAHAISLVLSVLEVISFPIVVAEILISLSIVMLAKEVLSYKLKKESSFNVNKVYLTTFLFGLIHGLGFADALKQIGLPKTTFTQAMVSFNVGIEFGQIIAVCILLSLFFLLTKITHLKKNRLEILVTYFLAILGGFWFIERFFSMF